MDSTMNASANVVPTSAQSQAPTPLEDLEKRLQVLKEAGVRVYEDGPLKLVFAPRQSQSNPADILMAQALQAYEKEVQG